MAIYPMLIGKESNRHEEVEQETIHDWDEARSEYHDPNADPWLLSVLPILKMMNRAELARIANVTERQIARLRNRKQMPSPEARVSLTKAAARFARESVDPGVPDDDVAACALYFKRTDS